MAREIPELVRAAAGLAATVLDEARKLPETLPGLPVRVIGLAMQQAMKVQQHYACLVARGDELFTGLRGENEPGLATFDDEEPAPTPGFRDSAFDRAGDTLLEPLPEELQRNFVVEVELSETETTTELPRDRGADALAAEVEEAAEQVEEAQQSLDVLAGEAPSTEEVLDELAIEEMVAEAPVTEAPGTEDAAAVQTALTESAPARPEPSAPPKAGKKAKKAAAKKATPAAAPAEAPTEEPTETPAAEAPAAETPAAEAPAAETPAAEPAAEAGPAEQPTAEAGPAEQPTAEAGPAEQPTAEAGPAEQPTAEAGPAEQPAAPSATPAAAPVDGYDSFTIAQLRGRLRGYALSTVQDLVAYEEATRARAPYLTMLRNRLEKLEEQAIESSPLAPRGV